jgi:hypothetical protein
MTSGAKTRAKKLHKASHGFRGRCKASHKASQDLHKGQKLHSHFRGEIRVTACSAIHRWKSQGTNRTNTCNTSEETGQRVCSSVSCYHESVRKPIGRGGRRSALEFVFCQNTCKNATQCDTAASQADADATQCVTNATHATQPLYRRAEGYFILMLVDGD